MYRYLLFCPECLAKTFINPPFTTLTGNGIVVYNSLGSNIATSTMSAPDTDQGPYCYLNTTSGNLTTGYFATSGFRITNTACRTSCAQAGCTMSRESPFGSGNYAIMSQCAAAEAFHYAPVTAEKEIKCPFVDMNRSTFVFRNASYVVQWYWLGWPTSSDCMNAVLCGPTSVYFDSSQSTTLQWCQPTPSGFFSPRCSNQLLPCTIPASMGDMSLGYWTSHGYGQPDGCAAKLVAMAAISDLDPSILQTKQTISQFTILATVSIFPQSYPHLYPSWTILLGTFLSFFVGIKLTSPVTATLAFFHANLTVSQSYTWIETPELSWPPSSVTTAAASIAVSFNGSTISFFFNNNLISSSPRSQSTLYSIGSLSTTSSIPSNWSSLVHIGPFLVTSNFDFQDPTTSGQNPYDFWSYCNSPIDFSITDIRFLSQSFSTTTMSPTMTFTTSSVVPTRSVTTTSISSQQEDFLSTSEKFSTLMSSSISSSLSGSTTPSATPEDQPAPSTPSTGIIVLITLVSLAGLGFLIFLFWRCFGKSRIKRRKSDSIQVPLSGWHYFNDITMISTELPPPHHNNSTWIIP